jgi:hypothetical protein
VDRNKLYDDILTGVIHHLHYYEMYPAVMLVHRGMPPADVIKRALEGGVDRYHHDPAFNAKCKAFAAKMMTIIEEHKNDE